MIPTGVSICHVCKDMTVVDGICLNVDCSSNYYDSKYAENKFVDMVSFPDFEGEDMMPIEDGNR